MKDKFERLASQVYLLSKKFDPVQLENELISEKLNRILFKIDSLEDAVMVIIPQLETELKQKNKNIKKLKKTIQNSESKIRDLEQPTSSRSKFVDSKPHYKFKQEECTCHDLQQNQKYKTKYQAANDELKQSKNKIEELQMRIKKLENQNSDLFEENQSQKVIIDCLIAELQQNQYNSSSQCMEEGSPDINELMILRDEDSDEESLKEHDEIETDDQAQFQQHSKNQYKAEQKESQHSCQTTPKRERNNLSNGQQIKQPKITKQQQQNSWYKKFYSFLF